MATSPNFNWPEPDNTDLVKNGALAIRTAVDAIDTSLVDLKGGTTGQVLSKASNTDMDFVWAADAGAPTSYGYAAGKNKIINGDFGIWQRGTSIDTSGNAVYAADRFAVSFLNTTTRETFTPGTAPVAGYEGSFFMRCNRTSNLANFPSIEQRIEDVRTFAGQTITVSFWVKSATAFNSGTWYVGYLQNYGSGGSGSTGSLTGAGNNFTPTTSWQRITKTIAISSISGKTIGTSSYFQLLLRNDSSTSTAGQIDIWGVQVEIGSTATAFQTATGTIQGELAACQRYYFRTISTSAYGSMCPIAYALSSTIAIGTTPFPVTMRIQPTSVDFSTLLFARYDDTGYAISALTLQGAITNQQNAQVVATVSGATAGNVGRITSNNSTSGYLGFSAEL